MATSGTTILELTRDSIINAALRKAQVLQEGQSANANQLATGAEALNVLVQEFVAVHGMPLWKRVEYNLTLVSGQSSYTLGIGQANNTAYPIKMLQARTYTVSTTSFYNVNILSNEEFNLLPLNSAGNPVSINYQPKINFGIVRVWPTPDASMVTGTLLKLTYNTAQEVFTAGTNTPDFPQEWVQALIYNLALLLTDEYGMSIADKQWLEKQAEKHLATALSIGAEDASLLIQPDSGGW